MKNNSNSSIVDNEIDKEIDTEYQAILSEQETYKSIQDNLQSLQEECQKSKDGIEQHKRNIVTLCHKKFDNYKRKYVKLSQVKFLDGAKEVSYGLIKRTASCGTDYRVQGMFIHYNPDVFKSLSLTSDMLLSDGKYEIEVIDASVIKEKLNEYADYMYKLFEQRLNDI